MLSRLSIGAKVIAPIAFLLVAMTIMGALALLEMWSMHVATTEIAKSRLPSMQLLAQIRANTFRYRLLMRDYAIATDGDVRGEIDKKLNAVTSRIGDDAGTYEPLIASAAERKDYEEFRQVWEDYLVTASEVKRLMATRQASESDEAMVGALASKAEETLTHLIQLNRNDADAAADSATAVFGKAATTVVVISAICILIGALLAIAFVGSIRRGLRAIISPMRALSAGDLQTEVPFLGSRTEFGQMADTLQVFKEALIAKKAADETVADETAGKIARAQRVDSITHEFEAVVGDLVDSLSSSSSQLEAAARTLAGTAESTEKTSCEAATASQEVSSNVQSVASATDQISSSVHEISRQVHEANRIASEAVRKAETTNTSIAELSGAASRIGDVIKLITAIADQTNLLALNATIEAARAGDAGRGFAVVASEVKALAAQTAKATEEIGNQITSMQVATEQSVTSIKEIGATIRSISEISATISAAVEQQGAATQEIARSVQQAAQRSNAVAANIADVSRGAGETGSASGQVLASAQSLSSESGRLKTSVDRFLSTMRAA